MARLKKIKHPKPVFIKGGSFDEMLADAAQKQINSMKYVEETGLCSVCKKNPAVKGGLRCQTCIDETERLLKQLRGTPGFTEFTVLNLKKE